MANELKTTVLAFERKLDPSDGLLYCGRWVERDQSDEWQPVEVRPKSVRGTASHRLADRKGAGDLLKRDMKVENPNPQTVDVATLPADADTLKVQFTLRVHQGIGEPCACNNPAYRDKLKSTVESYVGTNGFAELARRYAANLANGRFLWRNRMGAEMVEVRVAHLQDGQQKAVWTFDALAHSLHDLVAPQAQSKSASELAELIEGGLSG
ncbi:MAG: type I-F CRISPR-associated protein Csy3, partial [Oceanococcaceae bacterium]